MGIDFYLIQCGDYKYYHLSQDGKELVHVDDPHTYGERCFRKTSRYEYHEFLKSLSTSEIFNKGYTLLRFTTQILFLNTDTIWMIGENK